jgi:biopolymer transport protein ExbB
MIDIIQKGGPVMWPIAIAAIIAIAIILERLIYFFITTTNYEKFKENLLVNINTGKLNSKNLIKTNGNFKNKFFLKRFMHWFTQQKWNRSAYIKISTAYIENIEKGHRSREEALKRIGSEEIEKMERSFQMLLAISHVTPLLGLLGTVTGIIGAFAVISELGGQVDVSALAGGIWEAMLTTAAGLTVAIPAHLAYLFFEKIVNSRANRMSYVITYLNETIFSDMYNKENESLISPGSKLVKHEINTDEIIGDEVI